MTGFVVVTAPAPGGLADRATAHQRVADRAGEPLVITYRDEHVVLLTTPDLPALVDAAAGLAAVGDVGFGASLRLRMDLSSARRAGLQALLASYRPQRGACPPTRDDHHFVLYDHREAVLIAGHDFAGVRPVFLHRHGEGLTIASALRFISAIEPTLEPDEAALRRFVVGRHPAPGRTCYRDVERLGPGEQLTWRRRRIEIAAVDPPLRAVAHSADDDLADQFRETFTASVDRRLNGGRLAALLSGGLDSSSIAMVAARTVRPLRSLSMVFDGAPQWSERRYIEAVVEAAQLTPTFLDVQSYRPFADITKLLRQQGGLFLAPGLSLTHRVYGMAREAGCDVLLDGHGGDEVVSHGYAHHADLVREGAWGELYSELRLEPGATHLSAARDWLPLVWRYGPSRRLAATIFRLRRRSWRLLRRQSPEAFSFPLLAASQRRRLWNELRGASPPRLAFPWASSEHREHFELMSNPIQAAGFEILHASSSAEGISLRFPFWDREFAQFCLSLPNRAKVRGGYGRRILRDAMPELPELVRWRQDKLDFSPHHALGLLEEASVFERLLAPGSPIESYVDMEAARRLWRDLQTRKAGVEGATVQALWRVGVLGLWLESRAAAASSGPEAS